MPATQRTRASRRRTAKPALPATQRAIILTRMSIDKTGDGAGHDRQEAVCRALLDARGIEVVTVLSDTLSATKTKLTERPGWQTSVEMIGNNEADLVCVYHLDRLTRSMRDLEDVIDSGIRIMTATGDIDLSNDAGRLVGRILSAVARGEIERKSDRQVRANEQRAEEGRRAWVIRPFGFNRDGTLRENEAVVVRRAYQDLLRGKSLSAITRDFEESGLASTGKAETWGRGTVRRLLLNPRNAGLSHYYLEVTGEGQWSAIVDEPTWRAACRILEDPARHTGSDGKTRHVLSGIATCGKCDGTMRIIWRGKVKDETTGKMRAARKDEPGSYACYACPEGHTSMPVDFAEGVMLRELTRRADEIGKAELDPTPSEDVAPLRAREADLLDRLAELGEAFAEGEITRATMRAGSAKIEGDLTDVQRRIADAGRADVLAGVDVEYLFYEFDEMPLDRQRAIVRDVFERIAIKPRGKGRGAPKREHIEFRFSPAWKATK